MSCGYANKHKKNPSRPPPHPPVTPHHLPQPLLTDLFPLIAKPTHPLEPGPIQTQIRILQQLLLHEGRERSGPRDVRGGQEVGPGLEDLFVQVVDDVLEVQTREGGDQGALEAGRDGEDGADESGHGALGCLKYHVRQRGVGIRETGGNEGGGIQVFP